MRKGAILLSAVLLALLSALSYAQAPVPFINLPLIPDATAPGGPQFTLTVNGTGFVSNSVVNWNGTALATQFVNQSQLTATVPAADIATATTGWVTVVNPAPGGGKSNMAFFTVNFNTGNSVAFTLASSPLTDTYPTSVAVGDFNGDGKLDLAVANFFGQTVSILLGDGQGNFTSAPSVGVSSPGSVAVGDFNGDGKLDLAVASNYGGAVYIFLGDGTGSFSLVSSAPTGGGGNASVAVADLNGDGMLDLVVANGLYGEPNTVSVLLGDGTGNFTPISLMSTGNGYASVAIGDFNGDGKLDLAVTNYNDGTVSILLGDGTGNFTLLSSFPTGGSPLPYSVAVGDFTGDDKLDLGISSMGNFTASVSSMLGDGTGNFTVAWSQGVGINYASPLVVGDFNGDGKLDIASSLPNNFSGDTVGVWLGDGSGNFTLTAQPPAPRPGAVALGDFNGDGTMDIAVADPYDNKVSILLGVPPTPAVTLSPTSLTFGTQLFGTSSDPQPVTLTNTGKAPLNISKVVTSPNFSQTNNCPRKLPPGGQCTGNVVFTPHNVNTITGIITITDNAPNSPQTVPLTGVGTAVTLLPLGLDFGSQPVGTTSQPQTVTLTNYSTKAVTIFSAGFTGANAGEFSVQSTTCEKTLPANESCTANITFKPRYQGLKSATFEVNDNGGASPQTVALSGTGT
jgi:hypothetical protein